MIETAELVAIAGFASELVEDDNVCFFVSSLSMFDSKSFLPPSIQVRVRVGALALCGALMASKDQE